MSWRELALGPAYFRHRRLIEESKEWSREEASGYQRKKVLPLFGRYGSEAIRTKDHYIAARRRYDRWCIPGLVKKVRTGGTTGSPFVFYMDTYARRQKERAYLFDIWMDAGYRPFDLRVVYRGHVGDGPLRYDVLENAYLISANYLTRRTKDILLEELRKLPPFFFHVYPSSLLTFIDLLGEDSFATLPVRGILAGSEVCPKSQMVSVTERFNLPLSHWYGHSEYATLARYCQNCGGFHFYPTYGYTEFVRDGTGNDRIVATSFNRCGTQFVRYETGDIARVGAGSCDKPFERVDGIEGRTQEYFVDVEGQRYAFGPYLFGIHNEFWDIIRGIQFIQERPGQLRVRVALRDVGLRSWMESYLAERFSLVTLIFEYVDEIERTSSGKHRYFISQLA